MDATADTSLTLDLSRRFAAPPERVFDAWTTGMLGEWLAPGGATCRVVHLDPRIGGGFAVGMTMPDGREIEIAGTYREVERPRRLVFTWVGNYNNKETVIALDFRPDGNGTMMTLHQTGFADLSLREGYDKGWTGPGGSFDKLAAALAGA
ncbi:MAG TPA: SRPBCC domain-containing protein [Acidiphilium sp.]